MKNNSFLALSLIIVLLASACKKDLETGAPTDPRSPSWEVANGFTGNITKQVNNSMIFNDQLYALTFNTIAEVRENGSAMHFGAGGEYTDLKMPFTPLFVPNILNEKQFGLNVSPRPNNITRIIDLDSLAPGASLNGIGQYHMAANNSGQMLILAADPINSKRTMPVLLDIEIVPGTYQPSIGQIKRIPFELPEPNAELVAVNTIGNNFLVSYFLNNDLLTSMITPDGTQQVVAYDLGLHRVFRMRGKWYALGKTALMPGLPSQDYIYRATDEGINWELIGTLNQAGSVAGQTFVSSFIWPMLGAAEGVERTYLYTQRDIFSLEEDESGNPVLRKAKLDPETRISTIAEWRNKVFVMGPKGVQFMSADDFELLLEEM